MTLKITLRPRQLIQGQETEMTITLHNRGSAPCTNLVFTFQLPSQIMLLRGSHRLQIPQLEGGASWQHRLRVLPKEAGRFTFRSANFSYRDSHGISQRPPSRETSLEVLPPRPAPPAPKPNLRLFIREAQLREGEWGSVLVDLANEGYATAYQITVIGQGAR